MKDLLFGALAGDMEALSVLFVALLPVVLVLSAIAWLVDQFKKP